VGLSSLVYMRNLSAGWTLFDDIILLSLNLPAVFCSIHIHVQ